MDLTVLALHGLTSTTKVWGALGEALPGARRPELRPALIEWARYLLDDNGHARLDPAASSLTPLTRWPGRPRWARWQVPPTGSI